MRGYLIPKKDRKSPRNEIDADDPFELLGTEEESVDPGREEQASCEELIAKRSEVLRVSRDKCRRSGH